MVGLSYHSLILKNMNLVEKLRNFIEGTKMYSPLFKDPVTFVGINEGAPYPIICKTVIGEIFVLTQEGYYTKETAPQHCMLFPTPEMTWDGYFGKGDIIASEYTVSIVDHIADLGTSKNVIYYQACINANGRLKMGVDCGVGNTRDNRNATNGEKARILRMLAEAGYEFDGVNVTRKEYQFEPFEQVLVRDSPNEKWKTAHYSHREGTIYVAGGNWLYCIPYNEKTKHLRGTTKSASSFL